MSIKILLYPVFIFLTIMEPSFSQENSLEATEAVKLEKKGIAFYTATEYDSAIYYLELAAEKFTFTNWEEEFSFNTTQFSEGKIHCQYYLALIKIALNQHDEAIKILKDILPEAEKYLGEEHAQIANIYYTFGEIYNEKGAYNQALEFHKKALSIQKKLFGENHFQIARSYKGIANAYFQNGFYDLGFSYFQKEFSIKKNILKDESSYLTEYYNHIGLFYYYNGSYDLALNYFKEILKIHKNTKPEEHPFLTEYYDNIGLVYTAKRSYDLALKYFNKALKIKENKYGEKHGDIASIYNHIGNVYASKNAHQSAIRYYQKALFSNINSYYDSTDIYKNPEAEGYFSPLYFLESLQLKAEAFTHLRNKKTDSANYLNTLNIYDFSDRLIDKIRNLRQKESDKISLGRITSKIYEGAIINCLYLYKKSNDKRYLSKAFYFSEKSRSAVLLNNVAESSAKKFAKIPNHLLARERILKELKSSYLKELFNKPDSAKKELYTNKLFQVNREYEELIASYEKDFPEYYNFKYKTKISTLEEIQQGLKQNTTLLEYFVGDNSIILFIIKKDDILVTQTKLTKTLSEQIQSLNQLLKSKNKNGFIKEAHFLYQLLISPIENQLESSKIVIVPDGPLWYLNFDMLVAKKPDKSEFNHTEYLLHRFAVSYAYSANLLNEERNRVLASKKYECLAFSYSNPKNSDDGEKISLRSLRNLALDDLPGSRKEITAVSKIMDGTYFYGKQANEKNFKEHAADYSILHLALHGTVDEKQPMNSKLYFTPGNDTLSNNLGKEDNYLFAYELYNMDLNAELVVLSACNTGSGKLEKGEGVMSLGRAFSYAGCKSIIISQWKLSDFSTPIIMESFYKNLDQGMPKDEALRMAKLSYLEQSDNLTANPYYWASLIHIGDTKPLKIKTSNYILIAFSLFGVISIIVFFKLKRKPSHLTKVS